MKRKSCLLMIPIVILVFALGVLLVTARPAHSPKRFPGAGVALAAPPEAASLSFSSEAGIAAYGAFLGPVNLSTAKAKVISLVEEETSISVRGLWKDDSTAGSQGVHLYLDQTGFVLAYLRRGVPTSEIGQYYKKSTFDILLSRVLDSVARELENSVGPVSYWHFGFPDATRATIALTGRQSCELAITIPTNVSVVEASWAAIDWTSSQLRVYLDGGLSKTVNVVDNYSYLLGTTGTFGESRFHLFGSLPTQSFSGTGKHTLQILSPKGECPTWASGIALVYSDK